MVHVGLEGGQGVAESKEHKGGFKKSERGREGCCKVAPESWGIGGSKVISSKGLEGYEMFNPKDSRREDREEENA